MKVIMNSKHERGQGFIELGVSIVFLLVLLSVIMDLGYALYTITALRDAAQEAASYGAICPFAPPPAGGRNEYLIKKRVQFSSEGPLNLEDIALNDITVEFYNSNNILIPTGNLPVIGGFVAVTVTVNHDIKAPFVGGFIGTTEYPLTVRVADTVIRSQWLAQCDY